MGVGGAFAGVSKGLTSRTTIQADVSHYAENFLGEHDIKFGVQYTRGRLKGIYGDFFGKQLIDPETDEDLGFFGYYNTAYMYRWTYSEQYLKDMAMATRRSDHVRQPQLQQADAHGAHGRQPGFLFRRPVERGQEADLQPRPALRQMTAKFGKGGRCWTSRPRPRTWATT